MSPRTFYVVQFRHPDLNRGVWMDESHGCETVTEAADFIAYERFSEFGLLSKDSDGLAEARVVTRTEVVSPVVLTQRGARVA